MDSLLATYGSDDEDDHDQENPTLSPPPLLAIAKRSSLIGRLPPPKTSASSTLLFGSVHAQQLKVAVKFEDGIEEQFKPRSGLFAKLPAPKIEGFGTGTSTLFAPLSPSKGEFDSSGVKVEVGFRNPEVKKEKVAFKLPIDISLLEDDDDDWGPAQKKAKGESSFTTKGGGGLQAFLPAPKHSLRLGSALGGWRPSVMEIAARTRSHDVTAEPADVNPRISTVSATPAAVAKEANASMAAVQHENSVYAVDESAVFSPQVPYSNDSYGWTAPLGTYAPVQEISQSAHNVISQYQQHTWQYTANVSSCASQSSQASYAPADSTPVNDPVSQVLQAERRRGRGEKMATATVIEIKQAELTGGKVREDQLRSTGIAFGPSYQPVSSSEGKPSKLQRRKHQIGTLLHDMKAREMELLDRRVKGSLTKAETQAKYGW